MHRIRIASATAIVAALATCIVLAAPVGAARPVGATGVARTLRGASVAPDAQALLDWNTIAVSTVRAAGVFQAEGEIYMAYVAAAVYDAVTAIDGDYRQYDTSLTAPAGASAQAAAVAAAHRILVNYFPAQQAGLDASFASSLAAIPDGASKVGGVAVGEEAAWAIIALRSGDVRSGADGYTFGSGPGVWTLPYPSPDNQATAPQTPWIRSLEPFLITSPSQFRADPPPALTSRAYARQFNEVKDYGGQSSTARTPQQSEVARFWTANVINQYNLWLRTVAAQASMNAEDAARLLAMGNLVVADASIACWDSKYAYSSWRPVQAIRGADTDGNPATSADPTWTPFLAPTPNHPEYPSAHGCLTSALAYVLTDVLGNNFDLDLAGINPATNALDPAYTHHFDNAGDLLSEVVNARVWAGFHFRGSTVAGEAIGRDVARVALRHEFRPVGRKG